MWSGTDAGSRQGNTAQPPPQGRAHKALVVAFDHGGTLGPIPGTLDPQSQIRRFVEAGVDGVLLNPGLLRYCLPAFAEGPVPSLIVRLDWTTVWTTESTRPQAFRSLLLMQPEAALRAGADAVMTYLFLCSGDADFEAGEIRRTAEVARECERIGLPLIVEALSRGPAVPPCDCQCALVHTRVAVELGADAIKTEYTGDLASMRQVVQSCPVPILALGGSRMASEEAVFAMVRDVTAAGAAGVCFGRNVFQADDMPKFLNRLHGLLGERSPAPSPEGVPVDTLR